MDVYQWILRLIPEWLLFVMALAAGIGYLWRAGLGQYVPTTPWVLRVRGIVLVVLVAPFYWMIWRVDMPLGQMRAMSRVIFFALFLSMLVAHVRVYQIRHRYGV